jgi:hypothetical protein
MITTAYRPSRSASASAAPRSAVDSASPLQARRSVQRVRDQAARLNARGARSGLPAQLQDGIENLSGLPMDDVRVHYGSSRPGPLGAEAFAQGTDIHLAPGKEHHLPHEAWHVAQQKQGRVRATVDRAGTAINDSPALEHEADVMGARALQAGRTDAAPGSMPPAGAAVPQLAEDAKIVKLRADIAKKGSAEMQGAVARFLAETGRGGGAAAQLKAIAGHVEQDPPEAAAAGLSATVQRAVAQLYTDITYAPDLTGLTVPVHHTDAGAFSYAARPHDWYDGTFDALLQRSITRVQDNEVQVFCPLLRRWRVANDMQIGHITKWETYVRSKGPANRRQGIDAYNDLNNLRLESPLGNQSHDFEEVDEINRETYDMNDGWIVDDGEMDEDTRRQLDIELERLRQPRLILSRNGEHLRRRNIMDRIGDYVQENVMSSLLVAGLLGAFLAWLVIRFLM